MFFEKQNKIKGLESQNQKLESQIRWSNSEIKNLEYDIKLRASAYSSLQEELTEQKLKYKQLQTEYEQKIDGLRSRIDDLCNAMKSNMTAFPFLSGMIADLETLDLEKIAVSLDWGKSIERKKKCESIRSLRKQAKDLIEQYKTAEYQLSYLRQMFPIIDEVLDTDYAQLPLGKSFSEWNDDYDYAHQWLTDEEYNSLSEDRRNQLALDRYVTSHRKTPWQIGRDFEQYIGHRYMQKGYDITFFGIEKGMKDLGRDVIAKKDGLTLIIQCKYWSQRKEVHEKHILQLYGTTVAYCIENGLDMRTVKGILITNITVSDQARQFASVLNIEIVENCSLGDYPRIKCNIGKDGERIYHLPFDQQYDTAKISKPGEFFAMTVSEATDRGFRRAYRHIVYSD